jgi:cytochrome bd ubiquinol oxidase subunit II
MGLGIVCYMICLLLIGIYIVTDGFDLGAGIISLFVREEYEKTSLLYALWPVWNTNEIWLVASLVFLFSAFPPAYTAVLSSLYLAVILLLLAFILRAVALEFREKADWSWKGILDGIFGAGSLAAAFCLGIAAGNLVKGFPIDGAGLYRGGPFNWVNAHGLFFGLLFTVFCVQHGLLFLITRTEEPLKSRLKKAYTAVFLLYILLIASAVVIVRHSSILMDHTGPIKLLTLILASGAGLAVLLTLIFSWGGLYEVSFGLSAGSIFLIAATAVSAVYPVIVSSTLAESFNITVMNASTPAGLRISLIVAILGLPVVFFCNYLLYRVFGRKE